MHTRFIEVAGEINRSMPAYVVSVLANALNAAKKPLNGSRILVLGISYKPNVADTRESPSVVLMELLRGQGAEVAYSDPHVPIFPKMRDHDFDLESISIDNESLARFDAVVLATDHDQFNYEILKVHSQLLIDTRAAIELEVREKRDQSLRGKVEEEICADRRRGYIAPRHMMAIRDLVTKLLWCAVHTIPWELSIASLLIVSFLLTSSS